MRNVLLAVAVIIILAPVAWLLIVPSPIDAVGWQAPERPAYDGILAGNDQLESARLFAKGAVSGPEDVAVDYLGSQYSGLDDGRIIRVLPSGNVTTFADTGGRPLGLAFDEHDNLIVADAEKGLLSIDRAGRIEVLTDSVNGEPLGLPDDVDVGPDGTIYFSDASTRFDLSDYQLDLLSGRPSGRLLAHDPDTGQTRVLLDGLYFANGVAVANSGDYVLVAETWRYRITRYWLKGPHAGTADTFAHNLPGFPDGISAGKDNRFWVALPTRRNPLLDNLGGSAFVREVVARLPRSMQPGPDPWGLVLGLNPEGKIVAAPQDAGGNHVSGLTSAERAGGYLYLGSLEGDRLARWPIPRR